MPSHATRPGREAAPSPAAAIRVAALSASLAAVLSVFAGRPAAETPGPVPAAASDSARAFADRIAARYGLSDFPRVESIRFTFRMRKGGEEEARRWTWFPGPDSVVFSGKDPKGVVLQAAYNRKNKYSLSSETIAGIDKSFAHDQFWLLFPLRLAWDRGSEIEAGEAGKAVALRVGGVGPAPGAVYDILASRDGTILSWDVSPRSPGDAAGRMEWSPPKPVDGLPLSLERRGPRGYKVWFTDVEIAGLKGR